VDDDPIIFDHGLHIAGMMKAVEIVKTTMDRAVRNPGTHWWRSTTLSFEFAAGVRIQILEVQMPFADHRCVVTVVPKKAGNSWTISGEQ